MGRYSATEIPVVVGGWICVDTGEGTVCLRTRDIARVIGDDSPAKTWLWLRDGNEVVLEGCKPSDVMQAICDAEYPQRGFDE